MTSLLNISGTEIERINFLVSEARRLQIKVLPPDINLSFENFTVDEANIRFGLLAIKNIGANIVHFIIEERSRGGSFADLADFLKRVHHRDLNKKSLESLIKSGAFDSLGVERGQALDNIEELLKHNQRIRKMGETNQYNLFGASAQLADLKMKPGKPADKSLTLAWEKEFLGLYLTDHPLNAYLPKIQNQVKTISEIAKMPKNSDRGPRLRLAGIISGVQRIMTKNGQPMLFVTLEDLNDNLEILVFADTLAKYPLIWQENKAVMVNGRVSWRNDEPKLICDEIKEL